MRLKSIELSGFKSFAKKTELQFASAVTSIVGPNGSGKSNVAESFRFVLGEQSMKSMRGRRGEDMIWNGSAQVARAGRASVKLVFDNSDRALNLDFDEVSIERVVNRDGSNEYVLNGSTVRLRDISELLAQANIGASGHHIISQGEADRILSSSPRERREMLEDALGLTAYLYKREEAGKKLEKTAENMREVEGLRRELAPHLKFLQSQVRKIEESQKLRDDLAQKYLDYLKRESVYVRVREEALRAERELPEREHRDLQNRVVTLRASLEAKKDDAGASKLVHLEEDARRASMRRDALGREIGRIEGELVAAERLSHVVQETVPASQAREFAAKVEQELEEAMHSEVDMRQRVAGLIILAKDFLRRITEGEASEPGHSKDELLARKAQLEGELAHSVQEESRIAGEIAALRTALESEKDASREAERELFGAMSRRSELELILARLRGQAEVLERESNALKQELGEAGAFIGRLVYDYETFEVKNASGAPLADDEIASEQRAHQEERRKKIERLKIRLEESGLGNAHEILKEHQETLERDEFLARELTDLETSREHLLTLIDELTKTLATRFGEGIEKINFEFNNFFMLMFGGGSAALTLTKDDQEDDSEEAEPASAKATAAKEGVDISISLPHKRVKGLHMLSGGERALTSIALIFAMSQVNPPPFLILDETDAALDEANARRYGDMLAALAKRSQLIVITHNRETMSRAGILYGITMGSDGVSKLLSVRFEDALAVAK
ncbi:MAG: chromosome segregation protein [Patescibacteria group bacterium]|nr:chromosome segregation protein [Patescibacteria group bacterium]